MRNRSAFTLVEILIVVIILGILAAIVIPQFTNASEDAKASSVSSIVQTVQGQLELFKVQHLEAYPGDKIGVRRLRPGPVDHVAERLLQF